MSEELGVDGLQSVRTGKRVQRKGVKGPARRRREAERPDAKLNAEKLRRGRLMYSFGHVSRDRWAQAFGERTPEEQAAVFRQALAEQRARKERAEEPPRRGPAVHGDNKGPGRRLYQGFDFGLGVYVHGKAHKRAEMQRLGVVEAG